MQIKNRLFPYPVLNRQKELSCYSNISNYELKKEICEDEATLFIKNVYADLNNESLQKLLDQNKIKIVLIVECSSTIFRKYYEITNNPINIEILKSNLRDKVEISSFIYAVEDITLNASDLNDDYFGYSYTIDKYDVLAIDNGTTIKIKYNESADKKISSIFAVIKDPNIKTAEIKAAKEKIYIYLPEDVFNCYDRLKDMEYYQNEFFAILAIPALHYSIDYAKKITNDNVEDALFEFDWFSSVIKAYKKNYSQDLTDDVFKELDCFNVSQVLLNNGIVKSIKELFERSNNMNDIDEDLGGEDDE